MSDTLNLFVNLNPGLGIHPARWHVTEPDAFLRQDTYVEIAKTAERGLLDALFISDLPTLASDAEYQPWHSLEPTLIATVMSAFTSRIGVVSTLSTTYNEPYNIARRIASLDHLSGGRAAWNIVTTFLSGVARNFGGDALPDNEARYARADEFVDVVLKLWDSWEADAIIADTTNRRFVDFDKVHSFGHVGEHFSVDGPLQNPRTPQGRPVLVQAGTSPPGRALAAKYAEVLFVLRSDIDSAVDEYRAFKKQVADLGRNPEHVKILPGVSVVVGSTEEEAYRVRDDLDGRRNWAYDVSCFASRAGIDLDVEDLDRPVREVITRSGSFGEHPTGLFAVVSRAAELDGTLTVREFIASSRDSIRQVIGSPEQIADNLESWFRAGAADGFNLSFTHFPAQLEAFVDHVVPVLQQRGIFRDDYPGTTLRDTIGLPEPSRRVLTDEHRDGALVATP